MAPIGSAPVAEFQPVDHRRFSAAGGDFVYLISTSAVFRLDRITGAIVDRLNSGARTAEDVIESLAGGFARADLVEALAELHQMGIIASPDRIASIPKFRPIENVPLSTLVLNTSNKCNLACKYCYEYGHDRLSEPAPAKFMDEVTARQSVEFLIEQGTHLKRLSLTFFGGETLLNFPMVRSTVEYARRRAAEVGKVIDFSLTTNATLLTDEIIEFLSENRVGVTISIDGPRELQDRYRVDHGGRGTYDAIAPKIKELVARHQTRPVGARVTLTSEVNDVVRIFDHLSSEFGFFEIGFAPVTTSADTLYAISGGGFDFVLEQFTVLARRFTDAAVRGEYVGFSNLTDTLQEIHTGVSKNHACGAGLGLLGVSPGGDIALCHRFVDSPDHKLGHIRTGIDVEKRSEFNRRTHISTKAECHSCFARSLCSGGCYHEAQVRYNDIGHANLHYCDWIRGWIDVCLQSYAEISEENPSFFDRFEERKSYATS